MEVYLLENPEGSTAIPNASPVRTYRRHWTPVHLDFVVEDLNTAIQAACAAGATLETAPQSFAWGCLATLSDPFGHGFCFVQWFGHGYEENAR